MIIFHYAEMIFTFVADARKSGNQKQLILGEHPITACFPLSKTAVLPKDIQRNTRISVGKWKFDIPNVATSMV
jgi:hypothetical protein